MDDVSQVWIAYHVLSPSYTSVTICGTVYRSGKCWLLLGSGRDNEPIFGHLTDIISLDSESTSIVFVCSVAKTLTFDSHVWAYNIDRKAMHKACFFSTALTCRYLFNAVTVNDLWYIKSKYSLSGYL